MPASLRRRQQSGQTLQQYTLPLAAGVQAVYNSSGLQYYRHADWLGSSRFAGTPSGTVQYSLSYAPFGETYAENGTIDRSFTGQTQDVIASSQGIYDFLLRQHAASQGRWLVPDPAGLAAVDPTNPQTWNRYAYVANNPLRCIDRIGPGCRLSRWNRRITVGACTDGSRYGVARDPSWWTFMIQGSPQMPCAFPGACSRSAGGGGGGTGSQSSAQKQSCCKGAS